MTWCITLALAALAAAPPAPTSRLESAADYPNPEAVRRYVQGLLLEERGERREAQGEYFRALLLDPRATAILRRISSVSAALSEPQRSLEFARRALEVDSTDARSWWLQGAALAILGQTGPALTALRRAVALDSTQSDYYRALGTVAEHANDLDLVEHANRRLVWLDDEDGEAWFQLAGVAARTGRLAEAESLLKRAADLNPLRPGIHLFTARVQSALGHWPAAAREYRLHLDSYPDDVTARRQWIDALVQSGNRAEAYRQARLLARDMPRDRGIRQMEVELAFDAAGTSEGQRALDRLAATWPDDDHIEMFAVTVLAENGRKSQAVQRGEQLTRRKPTDADAWLVAARAQSLTGATDKAAERLQRAVTLEPDSLGPRAALARLYQDAKRYPEAVRSWREARERFPDVNFVSFELATCLDAQGNMPEAESAVRDVLRREPDNATALNFLGYLYADHNVHLNESVELIQKALSQEPDNGAFIDSLGWAYYRLGRLQEARHELERAVVLTQGDPIVHEHLGDVYKDLSQFDLARQQYQMSLKADDKNARVRDKLNALR